VIRAAHSAAPMTLQRPALSLAGDPLGRDYIEAPTLRRADSDEAVLPQSTNSFSKQHRLDAERRAGIAQPPVQGAEGSTVIRADSQM